MLPYIQAYYSALCRNNSDSTCFWIFWQQAASPMKTSIFCPHNAYASQIIFAWRKQKIA